MKFKNKKTREIIDWDCVCINSSLLSAQNRKRLYWVNFGKDSFTLLDKKICNIPLPKDKHILLKDILETGADPIKHMIEHQPRPYACRMVGRKLNEEGKREDDSYTKLVQKIEINSNPDKINTLTTFCKDNLICEALPCALRNRGEGKQPEFNGTDKANSLTTVQTDSMVCEPLNNFVKNKYDKFAKDKGYIPEMFNPYNQTEIKDKAPTLSTECGSTTSSSSVMIFDKIDKSDISISYFRSFGSKGKILSEQEEKSPTLVAAGGCGGGNVPAIARKIKVGNEYYDFYEGNRKEKTELDYVGGVISGREKWINSEKNNSRNFSQGNRIYSVRGKSVCLNANGGGLGGKTGLYQINLPDGDYIIRKLTPIECERLQTLCDNYTKLGFDGTKEVKISNSARYKALGNGWTVDVIVHILKFLKGDQNESIKSSISF